jgi:hypothetical protein
MWILGWRLFLGGIGSVGAPTSAGDAPAYRFCACIVRCCESVALLVARGAVVRIMRAVSLWAVSSDSLLVALTLGMANQTVDQTQICFGARIQMLSG